jgi:hypothetical protein
MGYACPVCEDPQSDAGHLANHLAFTAMLRGDEHEAWLDEHVPEWAGLDEERLGEIVADRAEEREFPQVFEDTTGASGHDHRHESRDDLPPGVESPDDLDLTEGDLDERARDVLDEAREDSETE